MRMENNIKGNIKMRISGKVVQGKGKGKKLGFPTINIELREKIDSGVYAGKVITRELGANGKRMRTNMWPAGIFIGKNKKILEAYLIDFSGDLYGKEMSVTIREKMRDVMKFENDEKLKKQIKEDIELICSREL